MTSRFSRWAPTPPFLLFLLAVALGGVLLLLSGCQSLSAIVSRPPMPDPRILLPRNTVLEVDQWGRLYRSPHLKIQDYRCEPPPMMCEGRGGVTMECRCP